MAGPVYYPYGSGAAFDIDPKRVFKGWTFKEMLKTAPSKEEALIQNLQDENERLRQRVYDLEHELGLKKGFR
jgi:hypothetical protein